MKRLTKSRIKGAIYSALVSYGFYTGLDNLIIKSRNLNYWSMKESIKANNYLSFIFGNNIDENLSNIISNEYAFNMSSLVPLGAGVISSLADALLPFAPKKLKKYCFLTNLALKVASVCSFVNNCIVTNHNYMLPLITSSVVFTGLGYTSYKLGKKLSRHILP